MFDWSRALRAVGCYELEAADWDNPRSEVSGQSRRADFQGDGGRCSFSVDMDDLVLQFDGTDAGKRFIEAWKRARIIVDSGGGHSGTPPAPPKP